MASANLPGSAPQLWSRSIDDRTDTRVINEPRGSRGPPGLGAALSTGGQIGTPVGALTGEAGAKPYWAFGV